MIHPAIIRLAEELSIPLVDRNAGESWIYNGKDLALWYQLVDEEDEVFPIHKFSDHEILHELGHAFFAHEEQRDLPEYGLEWGIVVSQALGPCDGNYRTRDGIPTWTYAQAECMGLVDPGEARVQECCAQLFCVFFGERYGISPYIGNDKKFNEGAGKTWDAYLAYKTEEWEGDPEWAEAQRRVKKLNDTKIY